MVLSYYHAGGPWQHTLAPGRHGRLPHPGGNRVDMPIPRARVSGCRRLPNGARKPIPPQYKGRADTSTITASRIPIMYRMEAPNALRYRSRLTTLR